MSGLRHVPTMAAALAVPALLYLLLRIAASLMQGYGWQEMDWQQRGATSIDDFLRASDIGRREVEQGGEVCVEYFAYKDGLPVKTVCTPGR